jgi:hypothetical protein
MNKAEQLAIKRGCGIEMWRILVANGATSAFTRQRQNARARGIEWKLSLFEWWQIWDASGHWGDRGRNKGQYVMSRAGDSGAYEASNVCIVTNTENFNAAKKHAVAGQEGVYLTRPGLAKPWVAYDKRRCIGYFATKAEGIAAKACI